MLEDMMQFEKENFVINGEKRKILVEVSMVDEKLNKIKELTKEYFEFSEFHHELEEKISRHMKIEQLDELDDEVLNDDWIENPNFHHRIIIYSFKRLILIILSKFNLLKIVHNVIY